MQNPDAVRLRHMQEAVTLALSMAGASSRADLAGDSMLAMALTRCLEVLGEAASKLSPEARLRFPNIPCARMISMRSHLVHAYSTWISMFFGQQFPKTSRRCYRLFNTPWMKSIVENPPANTKCSVQT